MIDTEGLFGLLAKKDWNGIAKVLYQNKQEIETDPVAKQAIGYFEAEFFSDLEGKNHSELLKLIEFPHLVLQQSRASFSTDFRNRLIDIKLQCLIELKRDSALSLANDNSDRPLAKEFLASLQQSNPEVIANARRADTTIRATSTVIGESATIPLFKSKQEEYFFLGVRQAFPTHNPYPNVALNSVLDFEKIKVFLSEEEKSYFFRALVDSVVFDPMNYHKPLYFFELDSPYHDNPKQQYRDRLKNRIFEAANTKLHRIRVENARESTVDAFHELVSELMRNL